MPNSDVVGTHPLPEGNDVTELPSVSTNPVANVQEQVEHQGACPLTSVHFESHQDVTKGTEF